MKKIFSLCLLLAAISTNIQTMRSNKHQIIQQAREAVAQYIDKEDPFESGHHPQAWKLYSLRTQLQDSDIQTSNNGHASIMFNNKKFIIDLTTMSVTITTADTSQIQSTGTRVEE
jgi:hypothetical protein